MQSFKDTKDRPWEITINVSAIKRVRDVLHVDLLQVLDGGLVEKLSTDPVLLCDVIFVLIKPQADAKNVSDEEFGAALGGDAIDEATTALLEELVNFSRRSKREALRRLLQKINQLDEKASERVIAEIDSGRLDRMLEAELDRHLSPGVPGAGDSSGDARASPASTPTP